MYSSDNLDNISSPKKNDKRFQICVEMLETEENYIRMLHMLITVCLTIKNIFKLFFNYLALQKAIRTINNK